MLTCYLTSKVLFEFYFLILFVELQYRVNIVRRAGIEVEQGWPCNGPLLELAESVAHRLIAAFDTTTGMPYGTVNLQHGVPHNETTVTCTAGVGTFILEFGTLSHLTGDPIYEEVIFILFCQFLTCQFLIVLFNFSSPQML